MTITSPDNAKLKEIRKLNQRRRARSHAGRFVAEGEDLLQAADAAGWKPVERLCITGSGLPGIEVEPELLAAVSELGSGTRTLAVYEQRFRRRAQGPLCVYLEGVGDPGNVGTILRSAEAFGAGSVAFGPATADLALVAERARFAAAAPADPPHPGLTVWRALVADVGLRRACGLMLRAATTTDPGRTVRVSDPWRDSPASR